MKMTLSKKLLCGNLAILIILMAIAGLGYTRITTVDNTYTHLIDDKAMKLIMIKELAIEIKQEQVHLRGYLLLDDQVSPNKFAEAHGNYNRISTKLGEMIKQPEAKAYLNDLNQIEKDYYQFFNQIVELKQQNNKEEALRLVSTKGVSYVNQFEQKTSGFMKYQQKLLDDGSAAATESVKSAKSWMLILEIIGVLFGVAIAWFISRIITVPVITLAGAARKIADGDLSSDDIKVKNRDELGELAQSFNQMANNLRTVLQQVRSNALEVSAASEELTASAEQNTKATEQIASTIQEVATGAESQVHGVEESSSAMEQISIGIQQIAANTQQVSSSALQTSEGAREGNKAIQMAVQQMNSINTSVNGLADVITVLGDRSQEIGQIVEVITGIAAQTNLLALNAAIEAARAGEHGRGFAVVADEVRKLAEQSGQSAQQISQLISVIQEETGKAVQSMKHSTDEVSEGITVVHSAGESFEQILRSINEVTSQIQEVSASVEQISAGTEQVLHSIKIFAATAEESASGTQSVSAAAEEQLASMEEIASSAASLSRMTEELQQVLGKFKV
ncbi:methyl-accepting chemotaxis protein [Neobacillus citreus]|uniref:Methyl-accepting chemotaxis protein n=1 Tax=Neobacillus citreus TaxID=2833578 RepID=A0A942SUC6_9BACI|nr:methyl-accepting chemotaxis protein [Neobacillus citreus]MCH6263915.1 methyl-accepting chemotaxis protein [Neobacillus citreus]